MRVTIYHNISDENWFGWKPGHPLVKVFTYDVPDIARTDDVLNEAWYMFNVGDPAAQPVADYRARRLRSLSVGDVIQLAVGDGNWFTVASVGFNRILPTADPAEVTVLAPAHAAEMIRERYGIPATEQLTVTVPLDDDEVTITRLDTE